MVPGSMSLAHEISRSLMLVGMSPSFPVWMASDPLLGTSWRSTPVWRRRRPLDWLEKKKYSSRVNESSAPVLDSDADHPIRVRLLDAAARVFARRGYEGTKIMDVVREAGLSTGAVYGRFQSKNDLLRAAVVERAGRMSRVGDGGITRVADLIN